MSDYIQQYENPRFHFEWEEADRLIRNLREAATIVDGVIRWNNNGQVPPADCVDFAAHLGLPVDIEACRRARDADLDRFLADYRRNQPATPSPEEQFELRAAFGPGEEVVDVLSGRRFST